MRHHEMARETSRHRQGRDRGCGSDGGRHQGEGRGTDDPATTTFVALFSWES